MFIKINEIAVTYCFWLIIKEKLANAMKSPLSQLEGGLPNFETPEGLQKTGATMGDERSHKKNDKTMSDSFSGLLPRIYCFFETIFPSAKPTKYTNST